MDSTSLDRLDRQLLHALHIDGRAPFSRIAAVLGTSDRVIAHRYRRLRAECGLRVTGMTDPGRLGQILWFVRIRCTPDAAMSIATALARRSDTSWVSLNSGGTEIICTVRTRDSQERDALLLHRLPRTPRVISVTAHYVLHQFVGGQHTWIARLGTLSGHQADELRAARPDPAADGEGGQARFDLGDDDEAMLAVLAGDGRASYPDLAAASAWSESTVRRRLDFLRRAGVLYFALDIDTRLLGFSAEAMLWLTVAPSEIDSVGETLAGHPEVQFAAVTTGQTNLVATVTCRDTQALYRYLTERIGAIEAIRQVESTPRICYLKRIGAQLDPPLLARSASGGSSPE
jgi:DNA-binding Lrp family transcriptional regulator